MKINSTVVYIYIHINAKRKISIVRGKKISLRAYRFRRIQTNGIYYIRDRSHTLFIRRKNGRIYICDCGAQLGKIAYPFARHITLCTVRVPLKARPHRVFTAKFLRESAVKIESFLLPRHFEEIRPRIFLNPPHPVYVFSFFSSARTRIYLISRE